MNAIKNLSMFMRGVFALVLAAGMLPAAQAAETVEYIHTDALGSPVAVTDANGVVIERTVYEPYGAVVGGQVKDGPGYTGHVFDSATGLSYMQQRYLDPQLGIFVSVDPIKTGPTGNGFERYAYALNNPYRFSDPDGRRALDVIRKEMGGRSHWSCGPDVHCRFGLENAAEEKAKSLLDKAWRGTVAHTLIQADITNALEGVEVRAERTVKVGGFTGRMDLAIRLNPSAKWQVFEIKPISHMGNAGLRQSATSQMNRYVQALRDLGEDAEVGKWENIFPNEQTRWVNKMPVKYGGVFFSGSYVYGPGEKGEASGIIYYASGPESTEK